MMRQWLNKSLRNQISLMLVGITGIALLLCAASFLGFEAYTVSASMKRASRTQAEVFARSLVFDLEFWNQPSVDRTLASFSADKHVIGACVYDAQGNALATYPRGTPKEQFPAVPDPTDSSTFRDGNLEVFQHIRQESWLIGTLLVRTEASELRDRVKWTATVLFIIGAVIFGLVLMASLSLQRRVVEPILRLATTAQRISEHQDYSIRLDHASAGELRVLTDSINGMMAQIQVRDSELEQRLAELRESQRKARAIFDLSFGMVGLLTPDGTLLDVNQTALDFAGLQKSDVLGRAFWETAWWAHSSELQAWIQHAVKSVAGGSFVRSEVEMLDVSGTRHILDFSLKPVRDEMGKVVLLIPEGRDITDRKRDEERLYLANFQSDQALDLTKAGYWHVPLDGSGWYNSSERAVSVFGDPPREDLRYRVMEDWFVNVEAGNKDAAERTLENYLAATEGRIPEYNSIYAYQRPVDGRVVWIHALGRVVKDAAGIPTDMYGVVRDITDQRLAEAALRESENRYRTLFDSMTDALASVDMQGRITSFNGAFVQLLGRPVADLPHLTNQDLTPVRWQEMEGKIIQEQVLKRGYSDIYEKEYVRGDGRLIPVELKTFLTRDGAGNPTGMSAIIRDITERRQAEEELARHREHLEELVDVRTQALKQAMEMAEAANRSKSAFLASMSHELRTPLNAVLGFAQLMAREPDRSVKDLGKLEKILRAGEHLLELINDVLSLSRIEAHKLSLNAAAFDLRACVDGIEEMIRVRAEAKRLTFEVEVDSTVPAVLEGDEGKLRQVLLNLLGNAVKFTETGHIGLTVRALGQDLIHFAVADTGPGISPEELSDLFGSFVQTEAGRRSAEGSGLGLNLSQALVGLLGGEISVESQLGRGSTFSFQIPLRTLDALPEKTSGRRRLVLADGQPALRQLVVDDKISNRELLAEYMVTLGFPVEVAVDGEEAVGKWKTWQPQVVWMDMRMPVLDGYAATRRIRALEADLGCPRTVIIAITASIFNEDQGGVFAAGCDGIIHKPFRDQELFEVLARFAGVTFLEEEEPSATTKVMPPFSIQEVEPAWRMTFQAALKAGDIEQARHLAIELPAAQEALSSYLQRALQEFRLEALELLFTPAEKP